MTATTTHQPSLFDPPVKPPAAHERPAPYQPASATSRSAGRSFERGGRSTVQVFIIRALVRAGADGLTIEQLADRVSELRGRPTKEATICGRVAGRQAELRQWVRKTERTRPNASGHRADVYVHRMYAGK